MSVRSLWTDLPLRRKGLVVVAIPLVTIAVAVTVLAAVSRRSREAQRWRAHTLEVKASLEETMRLLADAQSSMRGYLVVRDPGWLAQYTAAREAAPDQIGKLADLVADNPAETERVSALRQQIVEWFSSAASAIATPAGDQQAAAVRLTSARAHMTATRAAADAIRDEEDRLLAERTVTASGLTRLFLIAVLLSMPLSLFGAVVASWAFSTGVVKRIQKVKLNADRLAVGEPLEPIAGRDEVGQLGERLERAAMLLKERTDELEAFTYSVSHDLRAPLRHVAGFAELLKMHGAGQLDDKSNRYIDTISASAERMGRLIDDLLVLSRVGRADVQHVRVSVPSILERVIDEQRQAEPARAIDFTIAEMPDVKGDPSLLSLALTNLVSNAVKYTRPRDAARIEIGAAPGAASDLVIFIRDNGVGFDMRYVDRLFGVFQRLHRQDEFEGTGIGLAIVRRVAARHGGRAWAESTPGEGATFFLALPRAEGRAA